MNDLLQQLLSMGPAIGAGVSGNGNAMQAFMRSYQQTTEQLQAKKRQQQQDQMSLEDRQRAIGRQAEGDEEHRVDRATAATNQKQSQALRSLAVPGQLAEAGAAGAETPEDAKRLIESMMPTLMSAFGQEAMAFGQPAVEQATQVITGRQKKQVEAFVESALKVEHVANNPDADPEITNLPAHIQKIIGKPSAKLSELQTFAQLPVGKPQGKTRIPAPAGSMEEYSDPATTPERKAQIEADRRRYTDAGREADKPNQGAHPPAIQRRVDAIVKGFDSQPIVKRTQTMAEAVSFAQGLDANTKNPADDQALIYAFAKAMDPDSVVREGEYATVQKYAQSWAESFGFNAARVFSNTAFLTPQARENMKRTIAAKFKAAQSQYDNVRKEYGRKIERITQKPGGIEELTDFGAAFPQEASTPKPSPAAPASGPKLGERRKFGTTLGEWNGKEWVEVKP